MTAHVEAIITGTIGRIDTQMKFTTSKTPYITASIPESFIYDGEEHTRWHNITFWNDKAKFALRNFAKGTVITTTCQIVPREEGRCNFWVSTCQPLSNFGRKYVAYINGSSEAPAETDAPQEPQAPKKTTRKPSSKGKAA